MKYLKLFEDYHKPLLAPNGKESNLNNLQYQLVRTPQFKKWFGDWENSPKISSKVIDENGEPLIVYHGGKNNFLIFDEKKIAYNSNNYGHYGYGFYFSIDVTEAQTYGNIIYNCFLNMRKPFIGTTEEYEMLNKNNINVHANWIIKSIDQIDLINKLSKINKKYGEFFSYLCEFGYEKGWEKFISENDNIRDDVYNDLSDVYMAIKEEVGIDDYLLTYLKDIGIDIHNLKYIYGFDYEPTLHYITNLGDYSLTKEFTDFIISKGYDGVFYASKFG